MEYQLALKDLLEIKGVFDRLDVKFLLAYGTCLGFYRDREFLPEDDDIDLVVVDKISLKTRKLIGWKLYDLGFEPQTITFNVFGRMEPREIGYNGDENTGIIVCQRNIKVTIFFFYEEDCPEHGKEMVCIPKLGSLKLIASLSKFYEKFDTIKYKGIKFLTPSPIEEYLNHSYFNNWKDKTDRRHSPTYFEYHNMSKEQIKNIIENNETTIIK
jgi:hypothetical protein